MVKIDIKFKIGHIIIDHRKIVTYIDFTLHTNIIYITKYIFMKIKLISYQHVIKLKLQNSSILDTL